MVVALDSKVPDFTAAASGGDFTLSAQHGKTIVLYFYPKDNTPGCTTEGCDFGSLHEKFRRRKTVILGVSRDSLASHEKFKAKFEFPFDLLSDGDETLCRLFDVIKEKNMYGKKVMGVERSTFLIDAGGKLRAEWRKVSVKGHAADVLAAVEEL